MDLGLVSNCWRVQLDKGEALEALIEKAREVGLRNIELRQGCLGEFESEDDFPIANRLKLLPVQFPDVRFNIAICLPFMNASMSAEEWLFCAGQSAAKAVAGRFEPHLRLVDLFTADGDWLRHPLSTSAIGRSIAALARSCISDGIQLSVENSRQHWNVFLSAFRYARKELGKHSNLLQICFDPCNLSLSGRAIDPARATRSLKSDEISMIHFKQRGDGLACDSVTDGTIRWREVIELFKEKRFSCPGLFEIESSDKVWERLASSRSYLENLGLQSGCESD